MIIAVFFSHTKTCISTMKQAENAR